jgi:F0F1-type ATP synthase membrane subunit c/vacuolar-type H+-ATPase subunit K
MKKSLLSIVLIFLMLLSTGELFAQVDSLGIAIPVVVVDEVQNGDIICSLEGGLALCKTEYDPSMYGVITQNPSLSLDSPEFPDSPLAVTTGDVLVRVSTVNGAITPGDLITTSNTPGVGQKASLNGFALGVSMEEFTSTNADDVGEILVSLNIHPTSSFVGSRSNLISNIRQAISAPVVAPLDSLRYLLAFIIALISFALGFIYFGRVVRTGVEAIGRNPLAKTAIQATMAVNVIVTIVIVVTGLGLALLVLVV